jgi:hypothetical protein
MQPLTSEWPGTIWRMLYDADRQTLGLEVRDDAAHLVRFGAIGLGAAEPNFEPAALPREDWWLGLKLVAHGVVLVHGYADPGLPIPRDVMALDQQTGEHLWTQPGTQFAGATNDAFYLRATAQDGVALLKTDPATGTTLERLAETTDLRRAMDDWATGQYAPIDFPRMITEADPEAADWQTFLDEHLKQPGTALHYDHLRAGQVDFLSFYHPTAEAGIFEHRLLVRAPDRLSTQLIRSRAEKFAADPFLRISDTIVYIQDDSTLVMLPLGG